MNDCFHQIEAVTSQIRRRSVDCQWTAISLSDSVHRCTDLKCSAHCETHSPS